MNEYVKVTYFPNGEFWGWTIWRDDSDGPTNVHRGDYHEYATAEEAEAVGMAFLRKQGFATNCTGA